MKCGILWPLRVLAFVVMLLAGCNESGTESQGVLHLISEPEGAQVIIAGKNQGLTPCDVEGLKPATYLVELVKEGYHPLRKRVAWSGTDMVRDFTLEPVTGLLLIHSEPAGAGVEIAGAHRGETPLLLPDFPLGEHRVVLTHNGFLPREILVEVKNRRPQRVLETLVSNSSHVRFDSSPPGARVMVNGIMRGTTPVTIPNVPTGRVEIEMELGGFYTFKEVVTLAAGDRHEITAPLKPIPGGLRIVSDPPQAKVYINNEYQGEAPLELAELEPGPVRVRVELRGYESDSRTVEVRNGDQKIEEFRLLKNSGMIEVVTRPAGVTVFVDGEEVGVTGAREDASDSISDPLRIDLLSAGRHRVQLVKKGYENVGRMVAVSSDEVSSLNVRMKRIFVPDYFVKSGETVDSFYRGRLLRKFDNGDIRMEVAPGIEQTFRFADILEHGPLRVEERE